MLHLLRIAIRTNTNPSLNIEYFGSCFNTFYVRILLLISEVQTGAWDHPACCDQEKYLQFGHKDLWQSCDASNQKDVWPPTQTSDHQWANRGSEGLDFMSVTKPSCPDADLTACLRQEDVELHFAITSTTADEANETGYVEFPANRLGSDNHHMGPLKRWHHTESVGRWEGGGLSFLFSFISCVTKETHSQLVQRWRVEVELGCDWCLVLRLLTLEAAILPCCIWVYRGSGAKKKTTPPLYVLPQIR